MLHAHIFIYLFLVYVLTYQQANDLHSAQNGALTIPRSVCQNLTGCACISSNVEEAVALPGKCPSPGCQQAFLTFLCVICLCSMIGAMAQTPSVIILIRSGPEPFNVRVYSSFRK